MKQSMVFFGWTLFWELGLALEILGQDPTHIQVGSEDNASANADITQHIAGVLDVLKVPKTSPRVVSVVMFFSCANVEL